MFYFLLIQVAQLGTACLKVGPLSEGHYLSDSCSGWNDWENGHFFLSEHTLQESGHCKVSSRKLSTFPHRPYPNHVNTHSVSVHHVWPCAKETDTSIDPDASALQKQRASEARQTLKQTRSALCYHHSGHVDIMSVYCNRFKGNVLVYFISHVLKQQNIEI